MYHKIRIAVASLVIVTICMLSSAMTLSYFTDSDAKTNSFTVGNASTTLKIYDSAAGGDENMFDDSEFTLNTDMNEIPFYLQAKNDGNVTVYQRFRIVIPSALASLVELDLPEDMSNCDVKNEACDNDAYRITYDETAEYAEYYIVSKNMLVEGATTTEWPTKGIKITIPEQSGEVDYTALFTCENNDKNNCALGINVYSDVVQTAGFADAITAFANVEETY